MACELGRRPVWTQRFSRGRRGAGGPVGMRLRTPHAACWELSYVRRGLEQGLRSSVQMPALPHPSWVTLGLRVLDTPMRLI